MNKENKKIGYLDDNFKIFHIRDKKDITFEYHHHDFSKIVILIDGNVNYFVEGKCYNLKPWDILFVDKDEIQRINREFRQIDRITDVISFALCDDKDIT